MSREWYFPFKVNFIFVTENKEKEGEKNPSNECHTKQSKITIQKNKTKQDKLTK